jgi:hypothetical protein
MRSIVDVFHIRNYCYLALAPNRAAQGIEFLLCT